MDDIAIHQDAIDADDIDDVLALNVTVGAPVVCICLALESKHCIEATGHVKIYSIISGEGEGGSQGRAIGIENDLGLVLMDSHLTLDLIVDIVDTVRAGAQCDRKPVGTIVGGVAEGIIPSMNIRDGLVRLQIHEGHLIGFLFSQLEGWIEAGQNLTIVPGDNEGEPLLGLGIGGDLLQK